MANEKILYEGELILLCGENILDESDCFYEDIFEDDETIDEPICNAEQSCRTRSYRRKQEFRCKRKLYCNAINAMNNFKKREQEDGKNVSFCKRWNGHSVKLPKSLSVKAERIWKNAVKKGLL